MSSNLRISLCCIYSVLSHSVLSKQELPGTFGGEPQTATPLRALQTVDPGATALVLKVEI
jgi:hypothetical protein